MTTLCNGYLPGQAIVDATDGCPEAEAELLARLEAERGRRIRAERERDEVVEKLELVVRCLNQMHFEACGTLGFAGIYVRTVVSEALAAARHGRGRSA